MGRVRHPSRMDLPASFWACLAFLILTGMLCRRWPLPALYGATAAFCAVEQAMLRMLPPEMPLLFADALMFVLPTVVLVRACGMSDAMAASVFLFVPCALWAEQNDQAARISLLTLGIGTAQGLAAVFGAMDEVLSPNKSLSRWAAVCIAAVGALGIGFSEVWSDVAWTGVAAHAFACLAYLVHERDEQDRALPFAS